MTGIVYAPIGHVPDHLVILDAARRLYVGLSRDGSYWHVVAPLQADVSDVDGNVVRRAGELGCTCKAGIFHGSCYRLEAAIAYEASDAAAARAAEVRAEAPLWLQRPRGLDSPYGAGESVEASRG